MWDDGRRDAPIEPSNRKVGGCRLERVVRDIKAGRKQKHVDSLNVTHASGEKKRMDHDTCYTCR